VRSDSGRGRWLAAAAAVFLSVVGCTLPIQQGGKSGNDKNVAIASPSPSPAPSPTSTQQLAASAPAFHIGEVGVGYAPVALTATGGVPPYHWNVSAGTLPPGLTIGSDGSVSGTPAAAGAFPFSIEVSDSADGTAPIKGTINIAPVLNASLLPACAKYCNVELGCVNACGAFGQQAGGVGPFTYNLTQGTLPSGTALSALSLKGTFTGQTGYLQFTVQVTDSLGGADTVSPTFWMYQHISVAGDLRSCVDIFTNCSLRLPISGGVPNGNPSVALVKAAPTSTGNFQGCWDPTNGTPPAGYTLTVSGRFVVVNVPRPGNGYGGIWTIVVTDHTLCSAGTYCASPAATVNIGIECT